MKDCRSVKITLPSETKYDETELDRLERSLSQRIADSTTYVNWSPVNSAAKVQLEGERVWDAWRLGDSDARPKGENR